MAVGDSFPAPSDPHPNAIISNAGAGRRVVANSFSGAVETGGNWTVTVDTGLTAMDTAWGSVVQTSGNPHDLTVRGVELDFVNRQVKVHFSSASAGNYTVRVGAIGT